MTSLSRPGSAKTHAEDVKLFMNVAFASTKSPATAVVAREIVSNSDP